MLEQQGVHNEYRPGSLLVCSVCSFNRTHSHKLRASPSLPSGRLFLLLRTFWEITWLGSYLKDSGSLHNNMERTICRYVLLLSLVSRGSPSLIFHQKRPQRQLSSCNSPLSYNSPPSGPGSSHAGKGETRRWGTTAILVFAGISVLFSQCLMHQGKKKGWKKRIQPHNAQRATFHLKLRTRWKQGKQVPYRICNLSAFLSWFVMSH